MLITDSTSKNILTVLNSGGLVVMPTDTVYGLVCLACDKAAVQRLYNLKSREQKPGTVVAASIDQLVELGLKRRYLSPLAGFWPAALSIIVPSSLEMSYLDGGKMSLAVRVVAEPQFLKILKHSGPLLTSSANLPGQPPAIQISEAQKYFGDHVDLYVDGGDRSDLKPSTIIRVIDDAIEIVRPGAVRIDEEGNIS